MDHVVWIRWTVLIRVADVDRMREDAAGLSRWVRMAGPRRGVHVLRRRWGGAVPVAHLGNARRANHRQRQRAAPSVVRLRHRLPRSAGRPLVPLTAARSARASWVNHYPLSVFQCCAYWNLTLAYLSRLLFLTVLPEFLGHVPSQTSYTFVALISFSVLAISCSCPNYLELTSWLSPFFQYI